jgi:LysR family transcriptional regulator, hydrogen peroxide-inducible genes activator
MSLIKTIPTLKQLRHLVALAEFKHFGKAAEACLITQASLSSSIKELELIFGRILVERTKRSVKITPLGEEVVARAQTVLVDVEDIVDLVASQNEALSGGLRLGVIPTIAPFLLPRTLPAIRKAYPDLKMYLREAQSAVLLDDLKKGELDLVLIAFPYPTEAFETLIFAEDPLWFAFRDGAKIQDQEQISAKDIDAHKLILLEEGHCLRGHALAASPTKQFVNSNIMQGTSLNTLVQMVDSGLGNTIIPKMAIDGGIARGTKVELRPIFGKNTSRQIGFCWRKSSPRKLEFKLLANLFQAELATPITVRSRDR